MCRCNVPKVCVQRNVRCVLCVENFGSRGDGKKRVETAGRAGYVVKSKREVAWEIAVVTATESRAWQLM
jgi:predicted RNA-binding protein with TRAM domain